MTRDYRPQFLILAWCGAVLAVAAVVTPNINRLNVAMIPLVYCMATGMALLDSRRIWFWTLSGIFACSFAAFTWTYFGNYKAQVARESHPLLQAAIRTASADPRGRICVTNQVMFPYIHVLFANRIDPREFLQTVHYVNPGGEFQLVDSFGRFTFGLPLVEDPTIRAFVIRPEDAYFSPLAYTSEAFGDLVLVRPRE